VSDLAPLRRTIRGGRAFFFSDPAIDKILNMMVTLAGEVWALRERLAAMEAIGVRQGSLSATEVDDYEFSPEQDERLAGARKEFIESLFRVLEEQVESARPKAPAAASSARPRPAVFGARVRGVGAKKTPDAARAVRSKSVKSGKDRKRPRLRGRVTRGGSAQPGTRRPRR
jgi:hypothetical protein